MRIKQEPFPSCIVNGEPHFSPLPKDVVFVGMEVEPNKSPRYRRFHHWFNLPCYETKLPP